MSDYCQTWDFFSKDVMCLTCTSAAGFASSHEPYFSPALYNYLSNSKLLSKKKLVHCKQSHSDVIAVITDDQSDFEMSDIYVSDGIITNKKNYALLIKHADCFPLFLYDKKNKVFGIIHSGWKGAVKNVVIKGLDLMREIFQSSVEDIVVAIGPGARNCCYGFSSNWPHSELLNNPQWQPYIEKESEKYCLDIVGYIINSIKKYGIHEENIKDSKKCTICDDRFHSWTRQRERGEQIQNGVSIITLA